MGKTILVSKMTYLEQQCRELWRNIVKLRDRWCQICGAIPIESHHIIFQSHGNWQIQFDTDFGVSLCFECHHKKPYAPHVNNKLFLDKIIPRLPEERALKVSTYLNNPKKPQIIKPDFKLIRHLLKKQLKELKETSWMEQDIEPYKGTSSI